MRAGEMEAVDGHRVETGQLVGIDMGQLRRAPAPVEPVEIVGRLQAVQGVEDRAVAQRQDVAGGAALGEPGDAAGGDVDAEDRRVERIARR